MTKRKTWHSITEYQAMRALMQTGTTTGAAQQLGLSQSAISRSITNLETRTGRILFDRQSGRLTPTQEAVHMNRRLDPLFDALDRIEGPLEPVQEKLRLIAPPSYAHRFLISQINSFLTLNPHFFVSLEVNTSEEVIRGILDDRFDLGLLGVEFSRAGVKLAPYRMSQAVCVMHPDHPLASMPKITPADLHGQRMISLTHKHARRTQLDRLLHEIRAIPKIVSEVSTSFAAADLAKEGLGLAIINPFPLIHYRGDDLTFLPFESAIRYQTYFATSEQRAVPRIVRSFMRHLRLHTPQDPFSSKA